MNTRNSKLALVKFIACVSIGIAMSACATLGPREKLTRIESIPSGATVSINGFGECETPCTIQHNVTRQVTVGKAGYIAQRFDVPAGAGKVRVRLELAAPTEGVEEQTLPEL